MTVRDKLTLSHPPAAAVNTLNSVVTPGSFPSARSLHNLTVGPTVSPASRVPTTAAMQQQQQLGSEAACPFPNKAHAMDKAALSFILSSSDSENDADEASESGDVVSSSTIAKRKRSVASSTSEKTAAPMRKGSKFCSVAGCSSRAKHAKRCWKHGGSVKCKMLDCINRAKSKGVCWSHGGGTVCSFETCDTIAVSHGFCWAHGGGKRCQVPSCSKPAYERTQNYCQTHYDELSGAGTGAV